MSKLLSLIRRAPKRLTAAALMVAVAIIVPAAVFAWGPSRPTYTIEHPADHVTFDSITDNPVVGDERDFVTAKDATNTSDGGWQDNVTVQPGKEYLVRVYVHNNAASNLNLVATNTRVSASVPTTLGKSVTVSGFVSADNATPKQVWDDVSFSGSQNFTLAYVPGSAQIYNNGYAAGGKSLPDSIVTSGGDLIGYNGPDGKVPGCFQYVNYVYFKVVAQAQPTLNFSVTKQVSKHNANNWVSSYAAQPGEDVDYLLTYKNTGTADDDNVVLTDTLPTKEKYVAGSTYVANTTNPSGIKVGDNLTTSTGINIGDYAPGAAAYVKYTAQVPDEADLPCGASTLVNKIHASVSGYYQESTANVTVNKTCTTTPVYTCDALQAALVTGSEYKFTGNATAVNGATITGYVFDFGDGNSTTTTSSTATHTYALTGKTYTARLTVNFTVNGVAKTATSNACTVNITVGQPMCTVPGKTNLPANSPDCQTTPPPTPPELPHTGPTETILGTIGLGAIVASLGYFISSRRALLRNR